MNQIIRDNILRITERIEAAALRHNRRPEEIRLVAVGKTQPVEAIRAAIEAGATIVGENYIQEATAVFEAIVDTQVEWHFIGRLQSNKAKYAVRMFDLIHTVDSVKLASELNKQAAKTAKRQAVLIQVNISGEGTKAGVAPGQARDLVKHMATLDHLELKGFMTMPPYYDNPEKARPYFAALKTLRDEIAGHNIIPGDLKELSMGMTGDFEAAIAEGATLVRIGTALFGDRA